MKRADKEQLVSELKDKLAGAQALYFTDFTGLNVKRMTELRRRFRKAGVEYVVIKNTLALRAVNESGLAGTRLRGPTGVVVAKDPIGAAKVLVAFAKENDQRPAMKGGLFEGTAIDEAQVKKLATLPTREEALGQLVSAFNSVLMMFALALEARKTQLETDGGAAAGDEGAASSNVAASSNAAAGGNDAASGSEAVGSTAAPAAGEAGSSTDAPASSEAASSNVGDGGTPAPAEGSGPASPASGTETESAN